MCIGLKRSNLLRRNPLSLTLLSLALLFTAPEALAHGGHGNEFNQSSQAAGAIEVDQATVERIGLKVEPVQRHALAFGVKATGQIEASPSGTVEVTNPVGGTVIRLWVEPGDRVEVGQPLAVITSGELAELRVESLENSAERQGELQQAQAGLRLAQQNYKQQQNITQRSIEQARTELRVAQEQYDRDQDLADQGAISRREFLESEARLATAQTALTEAESSLEVLAAITEVERAETDLEVAKSRVKLGSETYITRLEQLGAAANPDGTITIKAPIAGTIADREVTLGQSAQDAGEILMTIVDDRVVLATANIYEKDLSQIVLGQTVRVTVSSLPGQTFEGQITTIAAAVEGENRVVPVKAKLENGAGVLKPGMFAELEVLSDRTLEPVLAIPQAAIVEANGHSLVFVQNGNTFQPVEVVLGQAAGDLVEVVSGLFEGDRLVTQRATQLYAQSLREETSEPKKSEAIPTAPNFSPNALPVWILIAGSGVLAIGTFAAGFFWASLKPSLSGAKPNSHQTLSAIEIPLTKEYHK